MSDNTSEEIPGPLSYPPKPGAMVPVGSIYANDRVLMSVVDTFSSQLRGSLTHIEAALLANDRATLARECHKACGSAATYGFVELKESLILLENGAALGQMPAVELKMLFRLVVHVAVRVFAWIELANQDDNSSRP